MKPENLEKSQNKKQLTSIEKKDVVYEEVTDTPFTLMTTKKGVNILIGNSIASEINFENTKEAKDYINNKTWKLMSVAAMILAERVFNIKKHSTL